MYINLLYLKQYTAHKTGKSILLDLDHSGDMGVSCVVNCDFQISITKTVNSVGRKPPTLQRSKYTIAGRLKYFE